MGGVPEADALDVLDVGVVDRAATAAALLDPLRARVLAALAEPGSATTVAAALDEPRQKVNYHVRALEEVGLVRHVGDRARRGLTERLVVATARSYVLSPSVLGAIAAEPARLDRLSARYLLAVAARLLREVGELTAGASRAGKHLPTLTIDTEVRFADAADRAAFADDLAAAVTATVARYHDESAPAGRPYRLVVAAHPVPRSTHRTAEEA